MLPHRPTMLELVFTFLGGLTLLFILAPLLGMVLRTPVADLGKAALETDVRASIRLTILTSMAATLVSGGAAIPLAYLLARADFPLKRLVNAVVDVPIVIPHSAAGIALLGVLSHDCALGRAAEAAGIDIVGGHVGIMAAMAFVSIPFLVNASRDGFAAVPRRLEKAALNLGASPARVFLTISVPLAWRSILSGLILMWARGMSEFGAVLVITYHPMITPVLIYERFTSFGLKYARPVSIVFVAMCLVLFVVFRALSQGRIRAER